MKLFAFRPVRRRRHRPLFAAAAVLALVGLLVLDGAASGVVLLGTTGLFIVGCLHRLSGEDTRRAEFGNFIGS